MECLVIHTQLEILKIIKKHFEIKKKKNREISKHTYNLKYNMAHIEYMFLSCLKNIENNLLKTNS
jgi:hypothetical protein